MNILEFVSMVVALLGLGLLSRLQCLSGREKSFQALRVVTSAVMFCCTHQQCGVESTIHVIGASLSEPPH